MCALRDSRAISATDLATHYRLKITPRRKDVKKVVRRTAQVHQEEKPIENEEEKTSDISKDAYEPNFWKELEDMPDEFDFDDDDFDYSTLVVLDAPVEIYETACRQLTIMPIKCIQKCLTSGQSMICKNVCLQNCDVRACCIAMVGNNDIHQIDFEGNTLGMEGARYFSDVIHQSHFITDLRLAENQLRSDGARYICSAVLKNPVVSKLDLSGNEFCENDAYFFKELLEETGTLKELRLGHNFFMEDGAEIFAEALAKNDTLRVFDLHWNHVRMRGASAIGQALLKNNTLERLNLAWNGLHVQGANAVASALQSNQTLQELDLTCNRFTEPCIANILTGLEKNSTLKILKIGDNNVSHKGALAIIEYFKKNKVSGIELLDLGDQPVQSQFEVILNEIQGERKFKVIYGHVWRSDRKNVIAEDNEDEMALLNENPGIVLMECMRLQNYRLLDMFKFLDKDHSKGISVDEFCEGLQSINIPLSKKALTTLVKSLDTDHDNFVNYVELIEAQKLHKQSIRKLSMADMPIEKTNIGKVSELLKKIMDKKLVKKPAITGLCIRPGGLPLI